MALYGSYPKSSGDVKLHLPSPGEFHIVSPPCHVTRNLFLARPENLKKPWPMARAVFGGQASVFRSQCLDLIG